MHVYRSHSHRASFLRRGFAGFIAGAAVFGGPVGRAAAQRIGPLWFLDWDCRDESAPSAVLDQSPAPPTDVNVVALRRSPSGPELLALVQDAFVSVVDRVAPGVVAIDVDHRPGSLSGAAPPGAWNSTGSGAIIRHDGLILTNQHVIAEALAIDVTLHDGRAYRARLVGADPRSDLAVLRIAATQLTPIDFADARSLRRGHLVFALGNPLGLSGDGQAAVSHGIISAIGRPLPEILGESTDRYYGDMIQTSAPINPGHSGGPLVDIHGRMVGVLTAVGLSAEGGAGVAFAVPIDDRTRRIIDHLAQGRIMEYGYVGAEVGELRSIHRGDTSTARASGVLIDSLEPGGAAQRAGLLAGDVVLFINGQAVATPDDFVQIVGAAEIGSDLEFEFLREGTTHRATVRVQRRPTGPQSAATGEAVSFRGAVLRPIDEATRRRSNLPDPAWVVVMVTAGSVSDRAGLTPGDIVVRIDGDALASDRLARLARSDSPCLLGLANGGAVVLDPE